MGKYKGFAGSGIGLISVDSAFHESSNLPVEQ